MNNWVRLVLQVLKEEEYLTKDAAYKEKLQERIKEITNGKDNNTIHK